MKNYVRFQAEITNVINSLNMEDGSDTPDYLLAEYLTKCLIAFDETTARRTRNERESMVVTEECEPERIKRR